MCCSRNEQQRWERLLARFEEEDRLKALAAEQAAAEQEREAEEPEREPELARA
jgi:hypothetical protein